MKKLLKYSLSLLCAIMVIGLTSCTDSYYDPAAPENKGAFLIANTTSFMFTPGQAQEFEITVQRRDTVEAGTVTLTSDNSKFNVPSQVSFGANEKTKTVTVTSNLESGSDENVNISVAEGQAYHYGANTITFNVKTPKMLVHSVLHLLEKHGNRLYMSLVTASICCQISMIRDVTLLSSLIGRPRKLPLQVRQHGLIRIMV